MSSTSIRGQRGKNGVGILFSGRTKKCSPLPQNFYLLLFPPRPPRAAKFFAKIQKKRKTSKTFLPPSAAPKKNFPLIPVKPCPRPEGEKTPPPRIFFPELPLTAYPSPTYDLSKKFKIGRRHPELPQSCFKVGGTYTPTL